MKEKNKYEILVSNDDGFRAPGVKALMRALMPLGNVTVVAPDGARSGFSSAITSVIPITMKLRHQEEGLTVYSSTGTPVDCVKLALNTIFADEKPDLVVGGINHGRNDGVCVLYSGTLGVAMEGTVCGIPSLAVSLNDHAEEIDTTYACEWALKIASMILENGLPKNTLLSMNVPKEKPKGIHVCPLTNGRFTNEYMRSVNARGKEVFWMQGHQVNKTPEFPGDLEALEEGYVALTPVNVDMTDYRFLEELCEMVDCDNRVE